MRRLKLKSKLKRKLCQRGQSHQEEGGSGEGGERREGAVVGTVGSGTRPRLGRAVLGLS